MSSLLRISGWPGRRHNHRISIDPVPLVLERIGRQCRSASCLTVEELILVERHATGPQSTYRAKQERDVRLRFTWVPQRGVTASTVPGCIRIRLASVRPGPISQYTPSPDPISVWAAFGEPNRLAQVAHPVLRIGRFRVGDPRARDVRHERHPRGLEIDRATEPLELVEDRFDHGSNAQRH